MSQGKNIVIVLLSLTAGVSVFWAWRAESRLTELQARVPTSTTAPSPPASLPKLTLAVTSDEATTVTLPATQPAVAADSATATESNQTRTEPADLRSIRESPEFQRLQSLARQSVLDYRYADLFRKLNLSPADLEKLKALLVERQSIRSDVMAASRQEGMNLRENRDVIQNLIRENETESDAALRNLLGESGYEAFAQYESTQSERNMTQRIGQRLSYTAAPLTDAQNQQLIALLGNTRSAQSPARAPEPVINDAVIAQARGFLSPAQIDVLTQIQAELNASTELARLMRERGVRRLPAISLGSD